MTDNKVTKEGIARERQAADAAQAYLDANAEIDALEPGPGVDALVAEKVMGWEAIIADRTLQYCWGWKKQNGSVVSRLDWHPSTDANQALEVAARALPHWRISHDSTAAETELWLVEWGPGDQVVWEDHWVRAATFPEAVCKAALRAVRT